MGNFNAASYENMSTALYKFSNDLYLTSSNIQSLSTVMTSEMDDDQEAASLRAEINGVILNLEELSETAKEIAAALIARKEEILSQLAQSGQAD